MRQYEASAKTVEEAVELGLQELGVSIGDVDVQVVEEGSKGLFGLFGSRPVKVRLTVKDSEEDPLGDLLEEKPAKKPEKKPEKKAEKKPEKKQEDKKPAVKAEERSPKKRNPPKRRRRRSLPRRRRRAPGKLPERSRRSGRWRSRRSP